MLRCLLIQVHVFQDTFATDHLASKAENSRTVASPLLQAGMPTTDRSWQDYTDNDVVTTWEAGQPSIITTISG